MKKKVSSGLQNYKDMCAERDKETRKATFMYVNMQKWAGENYDRDMAAAEQARQETRPYHIIIMTISYHNHGHII